MIFSTGVCSVSNPVLVARLTGVAALAGSGRLINSEAVMSIMAVCIAIFGREFMDSTR